MSHAVRNAAVMVGIFLIYIFAVILVCLKNARPFILSIKVSIFCQILTFRGCYFLSLLSQNSGATLVGDIYLYCHTIVVDLCVLRVACSSAVFSIPTDSFLLCVTWLLSRLCVQILFLVLDSKYHIQLDGLPLYINVVFVIFNCYGQAAALQF